MPKVKVQNGVRMIRPSGWDNFGAFMAAFVQNQLQQQQRQLLQKEKADQVAAEQLQFRAKLGELASTNPELYNTLIEDPGVRAYLDPARPGAVATRGEGIFERFMRTRRERKEGITTPELQLPTAHPQDLALQQGERDLAVKKQRGEIELTELQNEITRMRRIGLMSDDVAERLLALTGSVPSPADVAVAGGQVSPEAAAEGVVGTLPWKRNQANELSVELMKQYNVRDSTDMARVRAMAEWHLGLRDSPPERLPAQYAQLELELQTRAQRLREQQFNFDRNQAALSQRARNLDIAFALTRNGIPPDIALGAAQQYMQTGELPEGVTLDKSLETQLNELRLQQMQQELHQAVVDDPEVEALFKLVGQMPIAEREDSAQFRRLMSIMGQRFGWKVGEELTPGFWNKVINNASLGIFGDRRLTIESSNAAPATSTTTPTTTPTTPAATQWTPEIEMAAQDLARRAQQVYQNASPAVRTRLYNLLSRAKAAHDSKNAADLIKVIEDLELELQVLGNSGR
jgi:hypothetical protein